MSENNLQKTKKPNVVELNPLHIVQPVEIFQTLKANAKAWEEPVEEVVTPAVNVPAVEETEEVVTEAVEEVVENNGLRKKQVLWAVVAAVVFAAVAVLGFLFKDSFSVAPGNLVVNGLYIPFLLGFGALVLAISILVRFVVGCFKKSTCFGCEFVKLGWTFVVTTVVLCVAFAALGFEPFHLIAYELIVVLPKVTTFTNMHFVAFAIVGILFVLFLGLIVLTIVHNAKDKKEA